MVIGKFHRRIDLLTSPLKNFNLYRVLVFFWVLKNCFLNFFFQKEESNESQFLTSKYNFFTIIPNFRLCNSCFTAASQSNGYVPVDKCPICSLVNTTPNLTSLLGNNNIRDAFNSQTVSPIGFNPSTPTNSQTSNSKSAVDNTFSIWEPLPLSGICNNSRTQSFSSSSSVYPQKQQGGIIPPNSAGPHQHSHHHHQHQQASSQVSSSSGSYHSYRNRQTTGPNRSNQNPSTPIGGHSKALQFQFKERENNNEKTSEIYRTQNAKCTNCDENGTVVGYCLDCKEFLCSECVMAHARVKITKEHKIQVIDESFNVSLQKLNNRYFTINFFSHYNFKQFQPRQLEHNLIQHL